MDFNEETLISVGKYFAFLALGLFLIPTTWRYLNQSQENALNEADELMAPFWQIDTAQRHERRSHEIADYQKARRIYEQILSDKKDVWQAHYHLGKSHRAFGDKLAAQQSLAQAIRYMPERIEIIVEYVRSCLENNDLTSAYQTLKPSIKSFPDSYLLKKQLVIFLLLSNQPELTLQQIGIIQQSHPQDNEIKHYQHLAKQLIDKKIMPFKRIQEIIQKQSPFNP